MMLFCLLSTARIIIWLIFYGISAFAFALPSAKIYRNPGEVVSTKNSIQPEPSCEQLKAMWRFSKRQSRAAELTNELPMYRDPFADNVWEPYYATSRSIGGMRIGGFKSKPIYGRVVHNPPYMRIQNPAERQKLFEELTRYSSHTPQPRRRLPTSRLSGGGYLPVLYPPQQGSFNHLKELIKTERARELQQQRLAEESAARAAAMKEIGRNQPGRYTTDHYSYDMLDPEEMMYMGDDTEDNEKDMSSSRPSGGIISFPDLLAPAARPEGQVARFVSDYIPYSRGNGARSRTHRPTLFDTSSFHDAFNGYML